MPRTVLLTALLLSFLYPAVAQTTKRASDPPKKTKVLTSTFRDPATGVSFEYPAVWKLSKRSATQPFYEPPAILQPGQLPQASATFTSAGNYYARTNLSGLSFTYAAIPSSTRQACDKLIAGTSPDSPKPPDIVLLNGISFSHISGGGAGMCHQVAYDVYGTFRNDRCLLFESATHTLCPGVVDGTHELTVAELTALKRHLNTIVHSIRTQSQSSRSEDLN